MKWDAPTTFWDSFTWDSIDLPTSTKKKIRRMASNPTPENPDVLISLVEDLNDGLDTHEVSIGIKQNTKAVMLGVLTAYTASENAFALAKVNRGTKLAAAKAADTAGYDFLLKASKVLRIALGERWNTGWEATHFPDSSTKVPGTQDKRFTLLGKLKTYFAANPGKEAPNQGVTSAAAGAAHTAVSDARDALGQAETDQKTAKTARDAALENLRKRVRSLIAELATLLGPDDARWDAFGLSRPSDPDAPLPASGLTATPAGPGNLLLKWKRGKRATYYRVFLKILTVDTEPQQITPNPTGLSLTVENLPSGKTAEVYLIAANPTGEAPKTETVTVVVG